MIKMREDFESYKSKNPKIRKLIDYHNEINDYLQKNYNDIMMMEAKQKRIIFLSIKLIDYLSKVQKDLNYRYLSSTRNFEKFAELLSRANEHLKKIQDNPNDFHIEYIDTIYGSIHEIIRMYIWAEKNP